MASVQYTFFLCNTPLQIMRGQSYCLYFTLLMICMTAEAERISGKVKEVSGVERRYEKPTIIYQELQCEAVLCSCDVQNVNFNTVTQCGYEPEGLGFKIFAQTWVDCDTADGSEFYCYHSGVVNLFGS